MRRACFIAGLLAISALYSVHCAETVWLLYPESRLSERDPSITRLPESKCPTARREGDPKTSVPSDSSIEVLWHNPSELKGSSRLEVLSADHEILAKLEPVEAAATKVANGKARKTFRIPAFECKDCIIRLTQAMEDKEMQIVSCADVEIIKVPSTADSIAAALVAEKNTTNADVECSKHEECGKGGQCMDGGCFCQQGYFGRNCLKESKSAVTDIDWNAYKSYSFAGDRRVHWRVDDAEQEMELVLRFPADSWLAFGVRSADGASNAKCLALGSSMHTGNKALGVPAVPANQENSLDGFSDETLATRGTVQIKKLTTTPLTTPKPTTATPSSRRTTVTRRKTTTTVILTTTAAPKVTQTLRAETNATIVGDTTTVSPDNDGCGENEEFENCPEFSRECEHSCDWITFPESIPVCPQTCGVSRCVCKDGFVRMDNEQQSCVPFGFCQKEVKAEECPRNETWAKCGVACEPSCETMYDPSPCKASCQKPACTCADNYVRYNGHCIHWTNCPSLESRLLVTEGDLELGPAPSTTEEPKKFPTTTDALPSAVTRPSPPPVVVAERGNCAVNETMNECGRVCEADCITIFTRDECNECGTPMCACTQGYARNNGICVYWGDCPLEVSGLSMATSSKNDKEEKKAKKVVAKPDNTSVTEVTAVPDAGEDCYGSWSWPHKCKGKACIYRITWIFDSDADEVEFSLETKISPGSWTGIGFSSSGTMADADLILLRLDKNSTISINDMHSRGYETPIEDDRMDVTTRGPIGTYENGVLKATFARKRSTGDHNDDVEFTDNSCYKFLFPAAGGPLEEDGNIGKHIEVPFTTQADVCLKACPEQQKQKSEKPAATCVNEYRYPENCDGSACEYIAKWTYNAKNKDVGFEISSKGIGRWTGIGFSRDGAMAQSDVYTGWVYNAKAFVTDRFAFGQQLPAVDPADRQDIYNISGKMDDDMQTISFRRKLVTKDKTTDHPLDQCYYFLYPVGGGRVLAGNGQDFLNAKTPIGFHERRPEVSKAKICICDENGVSIGAAKDAPARVRARREAVGDPFGEPFNMDPAAFLPGASAKFVPKKDSDQYDISKDPFACSDVVSVQMDKENKRFRVLDGFAMSKFALLPDEAYGGKQSFEQVTTGVNATDGSAVVVIRRKLRASDDSDLSITDANSPVYLAAGQGTPNLAEVQFFDTTDLNLIRPQLITTVAPATTTTTKSDFKEHSGTGETRLIEKYPDEFMHCVGTFQYPLACDGPTCTYVAEWKRQGPNVQFRIEAALPVDAWTGIGFSSNGAMKNADTVVVSVMKDSSVMVMDEFSPGYGRPRIDKAQDIFDVSSRYLNGRVEANFTRSLATGDLEDDIDLTACQFFLFIHSGGPLEGGTGEIRKHTETPISSRSRVCLGQCGQKTTIRPPTTTEQETTVEPTKPPKPEIMIPEKKKPVDEVAFAGVDPGVTDFVHVPTLPPSTHFLYDVVLRIANQKWNPELEDASSQAHQKMVGLIQKELGPMLAAEWSTFKSIKVVKFAEGSVLSLLQMEFDGEGSPTAEQLDAFLKKVAAQGLIHELHVDPDHLKVEPHKPEMDDDKWHAMHDLQNIVIIVTAAIVALIIIGGACFCLVRSRRRKTHPTSMSFSPQQQAYQYTTYPGMNSTFNTSKDSDITKTTALGVNTLRRPNGAAAANGVGKPNDGDTPNASPSEQCPRGIGETTYQEWFAKVASKETPSHIQESSYQSPPSRLSITAPSTAYITYPNDPNGYYTMNGDHRMPPPSYYRQY